MRTVREECLDKLIINETHLKHVMREHVAYYNTVRPHQGIDQQIPFPKPVVENAGSIHGRKVPGGIVRDDYRKAA